MTTRNAWFVAVLTLLTLLPTAAHAGLLTDISQLLSSYIQPDDESIAMLRNVFGDFVMDPFNNAGAQAASSGSVLSAMFMQYNVFIFAAAMLWFSYTAAASLAQTMHEGVVFGQRMSTVWMPIRIAFGSVSLMPVFGGWAFCQALMMIATTLGIAGANSIATVAVASTAQFQTIVNPMGSIKAAASLNGIELNMIKMVACQEAAGALNSEAAQYNIQMSGDKRGFFSHYIAPSKDTLTMQFPAAQGVTACGAINLQFSAREDSSLSSAFGFRVAGINYDAIRSLSMQAHKATLEALATQARIIVLGANSRDSEENIMIAVNAVQKGYFGSYSRIFQERLAALQAATDSASNRQVLDEALLQKMKAGGWATLGIWYGVFAEANESMNEMLDPVITFDNPTIASSTENILVRKVVSVIAAAKAREAAQPANGLTSATGNASLGQYILGGVISTMGGASATGASNTINPIIAFKNIGDNALAAASAAFGAYQGVKIANELKNATPAGLAGAVVEKTLEAAASDAKPKSGLGSVFNNLTKEAVTTGGSIFMTAIFALFAVAALMAFYLPLIPFVQWFGALLHWFITVVESFLGASLWALAHFDSDGEGMGQRASYGYLYMLNNFARPVIMTLGFFIASAAVTVLGTYLFKYFGSAIASAQGNTMTGLLSIVAYLCIFGVMGVVLINNAFSIMLKLADTIIGFIGSAGHSAFSGDTENRINAMFVSATNRIGQGLRPTGKTPGSPGNIGNNKPAAGTMEPIGTGGVRP